MLKRKLLWWPAIFVLTLCARLRSSDAAEPLVIAYPTTSSISDYTYGF
jgi:hypothetical protein